MSSELHIPRSCSINSNFVRLGGVVAEVFDMTKNVPAPVLTYKIAQIRPQSHICHSRFVVAPFLDREAFEENEPFAIEKIITDCSG